MAQKTVRWFLFFFLPMRSTATGNMKPRRRQLWATADSPEEEEGGWGSQRLAGAYAPPCVMGRSAYDDANCNSCALWSFVLSFATVFAGFPLFHSILCCRAVAVLTPLVMSSKLASEAQIRQPFSHGDTCSVQNSSACILLPVPAHVAYYSK